MKTMIATATALEGKEDILASLIDDLANKVRKEPGNIDFVVFRDKAKLSTFRMLEKYISDDAFSEHLNSEHVIGFNNALKNIVEGGASSVLQLETMSAPHFAHQHTRGIDHVGLCVPDLNAATTFFTQAFGASVVYDVQSPHEPAMAGKEVEQQLGIPSGARIVHMRLLRIGDSATIEMFQFEDTKQREAIALNDFGLNHLALYVDDIKAAANNFEAAGGELLSAIHPLSGVEGSENNAGVYGKAPWGTYIELITTPDGIDYSPEAKVARWKPSPSNCLSPVSHGIHRQEASELLTEQGVVKMTMFLKRKKGMSHEDFVEHHIKKHGPLFRQIPGVQDHVLRYIQTHPIDVRDVDSDNAKFDGTAELWFRSQSSLNKIMDSSFYRDVVFEDEKTFIDHENTLIQLGNQVNIIS